VVKKTGKQQYKMQSVYRSLIFLLIVLVMISCSGKGEKIKKRDLIPSDDVVTILTDLYISDGILAFPQVRAKFSAKDSIANYIDIIKKHGYTKDQMDKTIHYYFINNPKKLGKMYDDVLAKLSEVQAKLETESPPEKSSPFVLWNQKTSFSLPESGVINPIWFNIPVSDTGTYMLSFSAIIYPDDQSLNARSEVFFWRADGTKDGKRDYWDKIPLQKDGIRHSYSVSKRLKDNTFTHISGWIYKHDDQPGRWEKHARITEISLSKGSIQ
jgi:hypothetical protein